MDNNVRLATERFVQLQMESFGASHDWWHIYRVRQTALHIAEKEQAHLEIVELGALLHDITDHKYFAGSVEEGRKKLQDFLLTQHIKPQNIHAILEIIDHMSFSKGSICKSIEQACVQDADRLDGIGAIGIARCFHYAGEKNNPLHDPTAARLGQSLEEYRKNGSPTAIAHFYDKLLLVKHKMVTQTGKNLAKVRHDRLEQFLQDFHSEWQ